MLADPARRAAAGAAGIAAAARWADLPERTAQALLALLPPRSVARPRRSPRDSSMGQA